MLIKDKLQEHFTGLIKQYNIRHFSSMELVNSIMLNYTDYYPSMIYPIASLLNNLAYPLIIADLMREDLGFMISINSSFRTVSHNKEIGGKRQSLHLRGLALDIRPKYPNKEVILCDRYLPSKLQRMEKWLAQAKVYMYANGKYITDKDLGIGYYRTFVHIDTRGIIGRKSPVKWYE